MDDEDMTIWSKMASLEDIRDYSFFQGQDTKPDFKTLKDWEDVLEPVHVLKTLIVLADEKNGFTFAQEFDEKEQAVDFCKFLSKNGLNTWLGTGRDGEDSIYVEIFASNKDYPEDFFNEHRERRDSERKSYHLEMGEFFGYPEKSVEAFAVGPSLLDRLWNILAFNIKRFHIRRGDIIYTKQALEKYGQDLAEQEVKDFRSLIFYVLEDSEEAFNEAVQRAEKRRRVIEEIERKTGENFLYLQDDYVELLDNAQS